MIILADKVICAEYYTLEVSPKTNEADLPVSLCLTI